MRDRQAQATARRQPPVHAVEALKDVLMVLGLDPGTVVLDSEDAFAASNTNVRPSRCVRERVPDQDAGDLQHALLVAQTPRAILGRQLQ